MIMHWSETSKKAIKFVGFSILKYPKILIFLLPIIVFLDIFRSNKQAFFIAFLDRTQNGHVLGAFPAKK